MLLLLLGYPNSPWQYHTQDGPVCIALAPCNNKKINSDEGCDPPALASSSSSSSSAAAAATFSPALSCAGSDALQEVGEK